MSKSAGGEALTSSSAAALSTDFIVKYSRTCWHLFGALSRHFFIRLPGFLQGDARFLRYGQECRSIRPSQYQSGVDCRFRKVFEVALIQ